MQLTPWLAEANRLFSAPRPKRFTDFRHCEECAEHDQTLQDNDLHSLTMAHLGNPGWDPVCFCSVEAKLYLMPALIRLTLETIEGEAYLDQFLFHLAWDGADNDLVRHCTAEQRAFICRLLQFLLDNYTEQVDQGFSGDELLSVYEIWLPD